MTRALPARPPYGARPAPLETGQKRGALKKRETVRKNRRLITVLIVFLGFTSPLSTDMCLPALSIMASDFGVPNSQINLIVIVFFFFMALCTLIAGPLSDRFGRKRVMLASLALFVIGNLACSVSQSLGILILGRAVSACGAGGMLNSSTALTKDAFKGKARDRTLSIVQVFQIVAPLLSPVIGAQLITHFDWHSVFIVLASVGIFEVVLACFQPETQPEDERGATSMGDTFRMLGRILKNRPFMTMLIACGCLQACFMAYLASSSYIYQQEFGVSPTVYSFFFSASALVTMGAPLFYMRVLYGRVPEKTIYRRAQRLILTGGICITVVGLAKQAGLLSGLGIGAPFLFWLSFLLVGFDNSIARPLGMSILLRQFSKGAGTLSATINFGLYLIGLIGMCIASLDWPDYVLALGGIIIVICLVAIVLFAIVSRPDSGLSWEKEDQE
jgi:DHA1 family bicyclomycin/chloramphenicol resistance-like MFS transporter